MEREEFYWGILERKVLKGMVLKHLDFTVAPAVALLK